MPLANAPTLANLPAPIVLLQRLACPLLPPNNNPGESDLSTRSSPSTASPSRLAADQQRRPLFPTPTGRLPLANTPQLPIRFACVLRPQPAVRGHPGPGVGPASRAHAVAEYPVEHVLQPQRRADEPVRLWNTHLDRNLISPVELLFVHGARPMDLTAQFVTGGRPQPGPLRTLAGPAVAAAPLPRDRRDTPHYDRGGPLGTHPGTPQHQWRLGT